MHPCRCCHPLVDRGLRGHVPARPECITPHIRFLFIALRFRLGFPPHPASRRRTYPSASLRLYKPGTGTFTQLDSCHARHTRGANPTPARAVGLSAGSDLGATLLLYELVIYEFKGVGNNLCWRMLLIFGAVGNAFDDELPIFPRHTG